MAMDAAVECPRIISAVQAAGLHEVSDPLFQKRGSPDIT
jgi:hypothetical protein